MTTSDIRCKRQFGQPATRTVNLAPLGGRQARVSDSDERDEPIAARITTHPLNARLVYFREDLSEVVTDKIYTFISLRTSRLIGFSCSSAYNQSQHYGEIFIPYLSSILFLLHTLVNKSFWHLSDVFNKNFILPVIVDLLPSPYRHHGSKNHILKET